LKKRDLDEHPCQTRWAVKKSPAIISRNGYISLNSFLCNSTI
jgi:hypothetical protein